MVYFCSVAFLYAFSGCLLLVEKETYKILEFGYFGFLQPPVIVLWYFLTKRCNVNNNRLKFRSKMGRKPGASETTFQELPLEGIFRGGLLSVQSTLILPNIWYIKSLSIFAIDLGPVFFSQNIFSPKFREVDDREILIIPSKSAD